MSSIYEYTFLRNKNKSSLVLLNSTRDSLTHLFNYCRLNKITFKRIEIYDVDILKYLKAILYESNLDIKEIIIKNDIFNPYDPIYNIPIKHEYIIQLGYGKSFIDRTYDLDYKQIRLNYDYIRFCINTSTTQNLYNDLQYFYNILDKYAFQYHNIKLPDIGTISNIDIYNKAIENLFNANISNIDKFTISYLSIDNPFIDLFYLGDRYTLVYDDYINSIIIDNNNFMSTISDGTVLASLIDNSIKDSSFKFYYNLKHLQSKCSVCKYNYFCNRYNLKYKFIDESVFDHVCRNNIESIHNIITIFNKFGILDKLLHNVNDPIYANNKYIHLTISNLKKLGVI